MRAGVIGAVLILVIIVASALTYAFVVPLSRADTAIPKQDAIESEGNRYVPVGAFLYEWYGYNVTSGKWTGGLGTSHWNDTYNDIKRSGPIINVVKDTPDIGFYASDSNATLAWQLSNMQKAGISVIILSWWGVGNDSGGGLNSKEDAAINDAVLNVFRYVESTKNLWNFSLAVMVEPFNNQTTEPLSNTDWTNLYDYIENTFYRPFNDITFYWQEKPLLLGFNPQYLPSIPAASIFTVRSEGGVPNPVNWYFWEGGSFLDSNGTKAQPQNYEYSPGISSDGEVGLVWRYDDYYQRPTSYMRFDVNGSQGMYNYEWNYAIQHKAEINLVLLYGWNEYHERTALEPHEDFTIGNFSGVGITSYYVKIFESASGLPPPPPPPFWTPTNPAYYFAAIVVVLAAVLFSLLFFLSRKKHDKLLSAKPLVKRVMSDTGLVETGQGILAFIGSVALVLLILELLLGGVLTPAELGLPDYWVLLTIVVVTGLLVIGAYQKFRISKPAWIGGSVGTILTILIIIAITVFAFIGYVGSGPP